MSSKLAKAPSGKLAAPIPGRRQLPSGVYQLGAHGARGSEISLNLTVDQIPRSKHITRQLVRDMVIPRKKPPDLVACVTEERLGRLMENAKLVTKAEREAERQKVLLENEKLREASEARRTEIKEIDAAKKPILSEFELEDLQLADDMRAEANKARLENEDQIRTLNDLLLQAKIRTIRDDQVAEKHAVKQQLKKAENELDEMMEKERVEGLKKEEEAEERRKREAFEAGILLREQIDANTDHRLLQKELKYKEGVKLQKHYRKYIFEDWEEFKKNKAKKKELLKVLLNAKDENETLKLLKKQESKDLDMMVLAFQKIKADKEEAAEAELKKMKKEKELETRRLGEMQERERDLKAEEDTLRARRAQEEKERLYRKAEKEAILKKMKVQEDLKKYQAEHQQALNHFCLLKAEREQEEHESMLEKFKRDMEKEEVLRTRKKYEDMYHGRHVLKQIKEKEMERINERKDFFREGIHMKQEAKIREQRLDTYLQKKMDDIKKYDIPKEYLVHIRRKMAK